MKIPEDIPEALRRSPAKNRQPPRFKLPVIGWGIAAIVLALVGLAAFKIPQAKQSGSAPPVNIIASAPPNNPTRAQSLLGHFPYVEVSQTELKPVGAGTIQLRTAAAEQFKAMVAAAQADGVRLVPISGFRSLADQKYLFFDVKAQRGQVTTERADVSAPPGYSEHHTGYAVDIGDGITANLSPDFEQTAAFEWLRSNAAHYSFELSFPKNNPQGVSYEPWHWRFVGDQHSLETFYKARNSPGDAAKSRSN